MEQPILISNAEVIELLQKRISLRNESRAASSKREQDATGVSAPVSQSKKREPKSGVATSQMSHRDWIEAKVLEYLQSTPCTKLKDPSRRSELKSRLMSKKRKKKDILGDDESQPGRLSSVPTGFDLTEAESLQLINFMPTEMVELHLMVEELHARMTEKEQDALLELISYYSESKDGVNQETRTENKVDSREKEVIEDSLLIKHHENVLGIEKAMM